MHSPIIITLAFVVGIFCGCNQVSALPLNLRGRALKDNVDVQRKLDRDSSDSTDVGRVVTPAQPQAFAATVATPSPPRSNDGTFTSFCFHSFFIVVCLIVSSSVPTIPWIPKLSKP